MHSYSLMIEGIPIPVSLQNNDTISCLLISCVIIVITCLSTSRGFIARQAKAMVYKAHGKVTEVSETSAEMRAQGMLMLVTCLTVALLQYFYQSGGIGTSLDMQAVATFFGIALGYYITKLMLYFWANCTFFDIERNKTFLKALLFISSFESVLFLPAVLLLIYFGLTIQNVTFYMVIVLIIVKIVTFYKLKTIFFTRRKAFIHFILYFCTLEGVPLLALWAVMGVSANALTID